MISFRVVCPRAMKKPEDRLDMLKDKYLKQVDLKQAEIAAIRQKIALLDELKSEADTLSLPDIPGTIPAKNGNSSEHSFASTGLTESVLNAVSWFGTKTFRPPEMRKHLLSVGFKPNGKNFNVSVATTLNRLAARGKLARETLNGKKVFRAKP